jgi:hypothetical protein
MKEERNPREELDEIIHRHPELIPTALNLVMQQVFECDEEDAKRLLEASR